MSAAARHREFPGGWAGSALLHGLLLASLLVAWPKHEIQSGTPVPVKIVTNAPRTDLRPAIEAPEVQTAQTETPAPDAPLEAPAPTPAPPTPTPPKPAPPTPAKPAPPRPTPPTPAPTPKPAPPTPAPKAPTPKAAPSKAAPARPSPAASAPSLDLSELRRELGAASGGRRSSAARGRNQAETDRQARPDAGQGLLASSIPGLQEQLSELWNPNCQVQGGRQARVAVTFVVGAGGKLQGRPTADGHENAGGVPGAAALRAIMAVQTAAGQGVLASVVPRSMHGKEITARFDPSQCSG
ncbi:MAG: energy transducer TonB [Phenylobacterium sp.]